MQQPSQLLLSLSGACSCTCSRQLACAVSGERGLQSSALLAQCFCSTIHLAAYSCSQREFEARQSRSAPVSALADTASAAQQLRAMPCLGYHDDQAYIQFCCFSGTVSGTLNYQRHKLRNRTWRQYSVIQVHNTYIKCERKSFREFYRIPN